MTEFIGAAVSVVVLVIASAVGIALFLRNNPQKAAVVAGVLAKPTAPAAPAPTAKPVSPVISAK